MELTKEDIEFGERVGNQFTMFLLAIAKAAMLGNEEGWKMPMKHYANMGFIDAEEKTGIHLPADRRSFVFNLVVSSLEKHFSEFTNKMNYNFCLVPDRGEGTEWGIGWGVGGSSYGIGEIYLWEYEKIRWATKKVSPIWLWSRILEEEHIHNLLRKMGIPIKQHHWFIDKILHPIALGHPYSEFLTKGEG